jgi:outer membrane protein
VGRNDVKPQPLIAPTDLNGLASGEMEDWVTKAQDAPTIRQATAALDVARLELDKAKAGHLPTVAAVASIQQVDADSTSDSARQSAGAGTTSAIGVELNMPLYSGGSVQNRVKEVLKLEEKAERDLDNAKRSVALATRQGYSVLQSGLAQVKALEAAEASAKLALEATQLGYRVGVRINKDVLDAQTALASTQKDLYKARYDVIVASVKLKQVAGVLRPEDLTELNKMIVQP